MAEKVLYVARDKDKALCAYTEEPEKDSKNGFWISSVNGYEVINGMENLLPELNDVDWSDEKPYKLKISLEETK